MKLWISECAGINSGDCYRTQTLDITSEAVASEPINAKYVRLFADSPCTIKFDKELLPLAAGQPEWFAVTPGQPLTVAAAGEAGEMTNEAWLKVIGDAPAALARAKDLAAATKAFNKAKAEANAATKEFEASAAAAAAKSAELKTRIDTLEAARVEAGRQHAAADMRAADLAKREKAHQEIVATRQQEWDATLAAFAKERADFDKERQLARAEIDKATGALEKRNKALDERAKALKASEDDYADRMNQLENLGRRKRA